MHTYFIHKIDLPVQLTVVFLCTQKKTQKNGNTNGKSRNSFHGIKSIYGWVIHGVKGIVKFGKVPLAQNKILEVVKKKIKSPLARWVCRCGNGRSDGGEQ